MRPAGRHSKRGASAAIAVIKLRTIVLGNGVVGAEKQALALATAIGLPSTLLRPSHSAAFARLPTALQLSALRRYFWT